MNYFDSYELLSREQLNDLQNMRLRKTVRRAYDNVQSYRAKMDKAGIKPEDIQTASDLSLLPFTEKQDLRDGYPYGMFASPMDEIVRIHASSGTTGKQTVVGYTENDLETWRIETARALSAAGAKRGDFVHVSYGYGLFTGGLGIHGGVEKLGATTIPVSVGNSKRQVDIMRDFGSTILCCTPSYALYLAETMAEMGVSPQNDLKLRAGLFGAEPWSENMRREIESKLGISAYDIYGLSEVMGPGVSYECEMQQGMHICEDHFIAEIINPDTGEVLPEGEEGELVFTCILKEALPLIRYRTKDITSLTSAPCGCGRSFRRMARPMGRTDDMLIIRGVNVFPSQIEHVLLQVPDIMPQYLIIIDRVDNLDRLQIQIEISPDAPFDTVRFIERKERELKKSMETTLGLEAEIKLVSPRSLTRTEGKAKRVVDNRVL